MRKLIVLGVVAAAALVFGGQTASAQLPTLPLTYEVRTVFAAPDGTLHETSTDALLLVPAVVDVDGDTTTGLAGADVTVQLQIDSGRATLRVSILPGASTRLPLLVEAILADPRGGSPLRIAFGYDALEDTAPATFDASIHLVGTGRVTSFGVDLRTVRPGRTLGVIAEVFTAGEDGDRLDPQRGRIDYTPVPAVAHFGVLLGDDLGLQQSGVDLAVDTPTRIDIALEDAQGTDRVRGDITIDRLPHLVSLILTSGSDGRQTWSYQASDRIDLIDVRIRQTRNAVLTDDFVVRLEDMATSATLIQDTPTHGTLQASGPIGIVEVGVADGRPAAFLDEEAYLYSTTDGASDSFAFRLLGLERAELDTGDPFVVDVTLHPGPFRVLIEDGPATIDAWIRNLPSRTRVELSTTAGTLDWTGSAGIAEITVDATDPNGIAGRATDLHLRLIDLPPSIGVSFGEGSGEARIEATGGGEIGGVDLLLTSGPPIEVDPGFDGVVLEDTDDHYAIAVRLRGLRLVSVSTGDPPYTASLRKRPGPFLVSLVDGTRTARIEVHDLPDALDASYDPAGTITTTSSAPIERITAAVDDPAGLGGRATSARLTLTDVPTDLTLSYRPDDVTSLEATGGRIGALDLLLTSGPEIEVDPDFDGVVLEDVDSHYALAARLRGLQRVAVSTGDAPYTLELTKDAGPFLVRLLEGARMTTVVIRDLPSSFAATVDPGGSLSYTASAPIAEITADLTDPDGVTGRATRAHASLLDLPTSLDVAWDGAIGGASIDAGGGTVGSIDLLLTSGPDGTLPADRDGVVLHDLDDRYVLQGRLTGLRRAEFAQGPPPSFALETAGGRPFTVDVRTQKPSGVAVTEAAIDVLPASLDVRFTSSTTFSYTASAPVSSVTVDATDPDGISGRATALHGVLLDLPVALDVGWAADGTITVDAKGGRVGLVEVQLTSGPDERLDPSVDGLLLNDLADRYVLFARLTGLRKAVGTQEPQPDVTIDTDGGRVLRVDMNRLDGAKVEYTRATLDHLVPSVRIRLVESGGRQEVLYSASAPTNSISFETNAGDRWKLTASVAGPLPASVSFCSSDDGACNGYARSSGAGAFRLASSGHTTVNVFDCQRPLDDRCRPGGSPSEYTSVENLRVRDVNFDADFDDVGFSGYTWMDTNGHTMSGRIYNTNGSGGGFEAVFPSGFWAENRHVDWDAWGLFKTKRGSINCPGGTSLSVRVIGVWVGVTSYMC